MAKALWKEHTGRAMFLSILRLVDGGETSSSSAIWRCSTLFTGEY